MDYERIEKPASGGSGFSPAKLRSILLGAERKKKEEDEEEEEDPVTSGSDDCKDVDVVSSSLAMVDSLSAQLVNTRSLDPMSVFEFQKTAQRMHVGPFSKPAPSKWDDAQKWIACPTPNRTKPMIPGSKKAPSFGYGSRQSSLKIVEVSDQKVAAFDEPDTKRIDSSQTRKEMEQKIVDTYVKPVLMVQNTFAETAINLSQHDSSISMRSATAFVHPPPTARSVSMRDMGTEMTPIASQEPSRNGTPIRATTPIRSPNCSRPSSPIGSEMGKNEEMSEKEIQMKTRREIMMLGTQLGKLNIAAWASKDEEDNNGSTSLETKSVSEARAAAWEEAEKAKYVARFKREEMKIQAWENHEKAKAEAEMRKIQVEVERIKGKAQDRLMSKVAAVRHKAEEKRAAAEAMRNREAAKTEKQAEEIRRTGKIPSSFSCFGFCS